MKYLKLYKYLMPFWKKELLLMALSGLGMLLGLVNPYLSKLIIDKAYPEKNVKLFIGLVIAGGVIFVLTGLLNGAASYIGRYIKLKLNFDLSRKVFKKLQSMPYGFFQDTSTGEHLYKSSYDVEQTSYFIAEVLPDIITLLPRSLFILIIVFYLDARISLLALSLAPLLYLVPYYFSRRLRGVFKVWVENSQNIFKRMHEVFSHIQLVKAFGKEKYEIRKHIRNLVKKIRFGLTNTRIETAGSFANNIVNRFVLGMILFYGGYQVVTGKMTLGTLSAITIYLSQLSGMQSSIAQFFQHVAIEKVSYERIENILDAECDPIEEKNAREIEFSKPRIEFRNVSFSYNEKPLILEEMSFDIEAGSFIGLVGPSGCGKTTIINLLLRLYKPLGGEIFIDGHNINSIKAKSLYEQIGVVLQEPYLWNDTIKNNILYAKGGAGFKEVEEAAGAACIGDFVRNLKNGYDTVIGENACKISEGQKQRIAIARAIIKKPKVLILDEALSSVDSRTEGLIINNLRAFLKGVTIIIISHRVSTIEKMEQVYFLSGPGKMEIAAHHSLQKHNAYQKYLAQFLEPQVS